MNTPKMWTQALPVRLIKSATSSAIRPQSMKCTAQKFSTIQRPIKKTTRQISFLQPCQRQIRSESTASAVKAAIDTNTQTSAAPAANAAKAHTQLPWNQFLALRKQRRRISLIASVLGAVGGLVGGTYVVTTQDIEGAVNKIYALDPIVIMGISTLSCVGLGWLLGPFVGNAVFNFRHRALRSQIALREREFYTRIKKYRVDPSTSSISNPVPDYYGEKIGSVGDYRRWLKDQRAFNLKRGKMA